MNSRAALTRDRALPVQRGAPTGVRETPVHLSDRIANGRHRLIETVAFGLAYFALQEVGLWLLFGSGIAAVWPPAGLALAVTLASPRRRWPALLATLALANAIGNILHHRPLMFVVFFPLANIAETAAGAALVRRFSPDAPNLEKASDIGALVFLAGAVAPAVGATLAAGAVALGSSGAFWNAFAGWWASDAIGVVVVAPLVLAWRGRKATRPAELIELVVACAVFAFTFQLLFRYVHGSTSLALLALPFVTAALLWPSLRLGSRGLTAAVALLAVPAVWLTARGEGPFAVASWSEEHRALLVQLFLAKVVLVHLTLAASIAQRTAAFAALAEANDRLRLQTAALERSNSELKEFGDVVSHDLSEPLRAVSGFVQLLEQRYKGALDERADGYIAQTVSGVARMQQLIADLLRYSQIEQHQVERSFTNANVVVRQVEASLRPLVEETGGTITLYDLPTVAANSTALTQLFQNLIGNALKFHRPGVAPHVVVSAERRITGWRFTVADNGIGVDARHRERIFKMFQRLHSSEAYPGTGIGLALCKKIVDRYGGSIWVEDQVGGGSLFRFELPDQAPR